MGEREKQIDSGLVKITFSQEVWDSIIHKLEERIKRLADSLPNYETIRIINTLSKSLNRPNAKSFKMLASYATLLIEELDIIRGECMRRGENEELEKIDKAIDWTFEGIMVSGNPLPPNIMIRKYPKYTAKRAESEVIFGDADANSVGVSCWYLVANDEKYGEIRSQVYMAAKP